MTEFKAIKVQRIGRVAIVCFRLGSSRYGNEDENVLRDDLRLMLEHVDTTRVVIALDGVTHCSSGTFGVFVEVQEVLKRRGSQLSLCHLSDHVREKLRTLNLDTIFQIYASESEAIAAVEP